MKIELTLKNSRLKIYQIMSGILMLINFAASFSVTFTPRYSEEKYFPLIVLVLVLINLIIHKGKFSFLNKKEFVSAIIIFFAVIWIKWELYLPGALNLVIAFFYIYANRKFEVVISESSISYPSFPRREIEWNELQNVIMKDGILTIDFKNNKLLQAETEEYSFNEKEFNEFCREQLKK
jgi:hypothetical protein